MAEFVSPVGVTPGLISLVIPVYNEAESVLTLLQTVRSNVRDTHETLLIYDFDKDTTLPPARSFMAEYPQLRLVRNDLGRGVLNALKVGMREAEGDVVVVTMADLSDDTTQISEMARRVRAGAGVVAGSRYMPGGKQIGGPRLKSALSRMAGLSLFWLTGIGTRDATNNFKAYNAALLQTLQIESRSGFEIALELTTKAHLTGYTIEEIPTTWQDRTSGTSQFRVLKWMPGYLRWYTSCVLGSWTGKPRRARRSRSSPPRSEI